jgi:hypothetical protein
MTASGTTNLRDRRVSRVDGRGGDDWPRRHRGREVVWLAVVLAGAATLYLRPHEDVLGGMDHAAYLHSGMAFLRSRSFERVDPLLSRVPPADRALFLYRRRPFQTKEGSLLVVSDGEGRAVTHLWFQPAYPLLMAAVASVLPMPAILYVTPVAGLLAGLAFAFLAVQILPGRRTFWGAWLLYSLQPMVVWQARYHRPEIIASCLLMAGGAWLLRAAREAGQRPRLDAALGAAAMVLAPFFHISAGFTTVVACALAVAALARGHRAFLPVPAVAAALLLPFLYQIVFVTDCYGLLPLLHPLATRAGVTALIAVVVGFGAVAWRMPAAVASSPSRSPAAVPWHGRAWHGLHLGHLAALAVVVAYLAVYAVTASVNPETLRHFVYRQVYRTDLRSVVSHLGAPLAVAALAGLAALAAGRTRRAERLALLVSLVPATLMVGNVYDFFMSRYLIVTIVPATVLGLVALLDLLPASRPWGRWAWMGGLVLAIGTGLWTRWPMFRVTELRGMTAFLGRFADRIERPGGVLLCEYSPFAGPMEHLFGVPVLGLPVERGNNYARAEAIWADILCERPQQPAYFMTPYATAPLSDRFTFEALLADELPTQRLVSNLWAAPREVRSGRTALRLYRMRLRESDQAAEPIALPHRMLFEKGHMGIRGFGPGPRAANTRVTGVAIGPDRSAAYGLDRTILQKVSGPLCLFAFDSTASTAPPRLTVAWGDIPCSGAVDAVGDGWWLWRGDATGATNSQVLRLQADRPLLAADIRLVGARETLVFPPGHATNGNAWAMAPDFSTREVRPGSELAVPLSPSPAYLLLYLRAADSVADGVTLAWRGAGTEAERPQRLSAGDWRWAVWPLPSATSNTVVWLRAELAIGGGSAATDQPSKPLPAVLVGLGAVVGDQ